MNKIVVKDDPTNCSDLNKKWEPDANASFEGNKIKLKAGKSAGTIFLKDDPKSHAHILFLSDA